MEGRKTVSSVLLICLGLNMGIVYSSPEGGHGGAWLHTTQQLIKRGEIQYCGLHLIEAVRNLCQGNYAALTRRSDPALKDLGPSYDDEGKVVLDKYFPGSMTNDQDFESDIWDGQDNSLRTDLDTTIWPKSQKVLALRILSEGPAQRRVRRSVTEECCKRSCRVSTMLKYCGGVSG